MSNLKRYAPAMNRSGFPGMQIVDNGGYVKFEDIKHLLPTGAQQPQGAICTEECHNVFMISFYRNRGYNYCPSCGRKLPPHAADVGVNLARGNKNGL